MLLHMIDTFHFEHELHLVNCDSLEHAVNYDSLPKPLSSGK